MRASPPARASLALPLALVLLAAVAPAIQADGDATAVHDPAPEAAALQTDGGQETVRYTVEAHDVGSDAQEEGDYWFTWNTTGDARNPTALLPAGSHVVIEFVNKGEQGHNLHIGGGIDAQTEVLPGGESETLEFDVPEDAPEDFEYWCDPHQTVGMKGNATSSEERYEELTTEELEVAGHDEGSEYWFTTPRFGEAENPPLLFQPGTTYEVAFVNEGSVEHNFVVGGPVDANTSLIAGGEEENVTFTVPSNATGTFSYWCDPHKGLGMQGEVYTNATAYEDAIEGLVGDGEHMDIESLGVDYLAYWVGVIAFALLFVLYGLYYFVFKHEMGNTTDHKDRTGGPEPSSWDRIVGWILFVATIAAVFTLAAGQLGHL